MTRRLMPRLRRLAGVRPVELSRRAVLSGVGASALFSCVRRDGLLRAEVTSPLRVAVIGGGLAGLTCATRLLDKGLGVTLFEANTRVGGRTFTDRTTFPGRTVELGGEFVDSWHEQLQGLVSALGLELDDTWEDDGVSEIIGALEGDLLKEDDLEELEGRFRQAIERGLEKTIDPSRITYRRASDYARALDSMSAAEWLDRAGVPKDRARVAFEAGFVSLYGGGVDEASALVLLQEVVGSGPESDERYVVRGGVGQVAELLAQRFPANVLQLGHRVSALAPGAEGKVAVTTEVQGVAKTETFDAVVSAIPFSLLRDVDVRVPLSDVKRKAIATLHMGAASKLCVGFDGRPWRALEAAGAVLSDTGFPYCWDATRLQEAEDGVITFFTGGLTGRLLGKVDLGVDRAGAIEIFNRVFPGARAAAQPQSVAVSWANEPFAKGGYALYAPGQVTSLRGSEREPEGRLFFAGEHTELDTQGYMEGAVRSGVRAAREVLEALG